MSSSRVYDCAWGTCTQQVFPPPGGNWGTPYKIIKVGAATGSSIYLGDDVYFYGMQHRNWAENHIINCDASKCDGSSANTITGSTFTLVGKPPLLSKTDVKLRKGSTDVEWNTGLQASTSSTEQLWNLRKCSGTEANSCLGNDPAWSANGPIKSGDVVAWVSKSSSRVYDCAWGTC